ncbi:hypothetical protein Trihar35433_158 [Trichoderma harzianum]|nr:hypothetical protein Trihar35433_158 [Trichoderma harzianum]
MKSLTPAIIASSLLSLGVAADGVFVCPGPNWTPSNLCMDVQMTDGGCWTSPWETLGAIGPDSGWICSMWVEPGNCVATSGNLNSGGIEAPGVGDLQTWNDGHTGKPTGYWFNEARSVQCVRA